MVLSKWALFFSSSSCALFVLDLVWTLVWLEKIKCSRGAGRYGGGTARRGAARTFNFFQLLYLIQYNYTVLYIHYCIYSTVKSSLDFQNKLKIRAPPAPSIPDIIKSLRWGAREFLIFFNNYIGYSTVIQYCIYTTVYTVLYSTVATVLLQQYCCKSTVATVLL